MRAMGLPSSFTSSARAEAEAATQAAAEQQQAAVQAAWAAYLGQGSMCSGQGPGTATGRTTTTSTQASEWVAWRLATDWAIH
jgi:hypothetical protein